jgi:hypothetical protein
VVEIGGGVIPSGSTTRNRRWHAGGDYAIEKSSTTAPAAAEFACEGWFDPIEDELRGRVREFLEAMIEEEATAALGRGRYERGAKTG